MNNLVFVPKLMPLLPMAVVALTTLLVMVMIAVRRSHVGVALLSVAGLNIALVIAMLQFFGVMAVPANADRLFVVDGFSQFNTIAILLSALACISFSYNYFNTLKSNKEELYLLMLVATLGAVMMVSARHFASFFMALELLSVPMYGMLAYTYLKSKSLESGIKYLILSAVASATLLMGMAFIFAGTGTLLFSQIAEGMIFGHNIGPLLILGAVMIVIAVAFKLSLAPFHAWAGDVYEGAPVPITTFLASVSKVAAVALAVRFFIGSAVPALIPVDGVLVFLIVASVLVGNLLAMYQTNLKRLLAYSSIAHMGYVMMALVATGSTADSVVSMYMMVYALTSIAAFGVIVLMSGCVQGVEADDMSAYQGLFWRRPVLTAVMTVAFLSLAGIPLTAGFMTKVQVMLAVVQGGRFGLAAMLIVGSAIGLYYYLKTILIMYKRPLEHVVFDVPDNWRMRSNGLIVILVAIILFIWGVLPNSLLHWGTMATIVQ